MSLWRHRDFLRLWGAQTVSDFGARISREGLPLAAVLTIEARPHQLGVLAALSIAPRLIVGLTAGGLVDRTRRRRLMIWTDVIRALLVATVPLAAWLHWLTIGQLYVAAFLVGLASVLFDIADHAYLPDLVGEQHLLEANAKVTLTESLAEIAGPALTGALVQALTAPIAMAVNGVTYLLSGALLLGIRKQEPAPQPHPDDGPAHWAADLRDGYGAIRGQPLVLPLFLMAVGSGFAGSFFAPLYLYFALTELHVSPFALGIAIAVGGLGALAGSLLGPRLARRFGPGPTIIATTFVTACSTFLIAFAPAGPVGGMAALVVSQFLGDCFGVIPHVQGATLRQIVLPNRLLGRVGALFQAGPGAVSIAGALAGGVLAEVIGVRPTLFLGSAGLLLFGLIPLFSPLRGLREMPAGTPPVPLA